MTQSLQEDLFPELIALDCQMPHNLQCTWSVTGSKIDVPRGYHIHNLCLVCFEPEKLINIHEVKTLEVQDGKRDIYAPSSGDCQLIAKIGI